MDPETTTPSFDSLTQVANDGANDQPVLEATTSIPAPTKAKVMFEQVELFELEPDEARDTVYLRKLLEPHYPAATDAKFEYKQEGDCLVVTMIKQNPPKG
ncbi:MAG TPA: hypothetical protein VFD70_04825 [Anaerolineae bacterium]|nr:hypothetical protein [Anaerolineae bacterium]